MANRALTRPELDDTRSTVIKNVHRHHRRAFRAAVTFQRTHAKLLFKSAGHAFWKFFRAYQHATQAGKILFGNTPCISLQERWSGNHESYAVLPRQLADNLRIQRAGMEYHPYAIRCCEPQGDRKPKRVKEGQHAHDFVFA